LLVTTYRYHVESKTMFLAFALVTTSVGGTLDSLLQIKIPGGFTAASRTVTDFFLTTEQRQQGLLTPVPPDRRS
jgi:hypothetical protein